MTEEQQNIPSEDETQAMEEKLQATAEEQQRKRKEQEEQEVSDALSFFRRVGKPLIIILIVAAIPLLGISIKRTQAKKKTTAADTLMRVANSASDYETIINTYPNTPPAAIALMALANDKLYAGNTDEAKRYFTKFTTKYKTHEMLPQAELNLIACTEMQGEFDSAQRDYAQFVTNHSDSFLAPMALMGQARCLEKLEQWDDARIIYEDIQINYTSGGWAQKAMRARQKLKNK